MLLDLLSADVDPGEGDGDQAHDDEEADGELDVHCAAKRAAGDHQGAYVGDREEKDDDVAVDAVEDDQFVADDGDKLEDDEERTGEDGGEVED